MERNSSLWRFASSASARARCSASYSRARSSAWVQCCATDTSRAMYSLSKFTGTLKSNRSTPAGAPSTSSGRTADDTYAASAAVVAERQYCSCDSSHDAMKIGARVCRASARSEEHTSELQSQSNLVCRLLLEKKKK